MVLGLQDLIREADRLFVEGNLAEGEAKLAEAQQAAHGPEAMSERQREIRDRVEALDREKKAIAKTVFDAWYAELQHVIRASEHALFIELLDSSRDEMYAFQNRHGLTGTLDKPYDFLVKDHHIAGLTAPERSSEWQSGNRWYAGRR